MTECLILCSDLFFTSKVGGTAQMLGINAETVMNPGQAAKIISENTNVKGLILDLTVPGLKLEEFLDLVPQKIKERTIAFGPHVEKEALDLALKKGCGLVLPRSRFSSDLPEILKKYFLADETDS
jgi:hypothetical protein